MTMAGCELGWQSMHCLFMRYAINLADLDGEARTGLRQAAAAVARQLGSRATGHTLELAAGKRRNEERMMRFKRNKRIWLFILCGICNGLLTTTLACAADAGISEACKSLDFHRSYGGLQIDSPGTYCLRASAEFPRSFSISEGRERPHVEPAIRIFSSDVEINFGGMSLTLQARDMRGLVAGDWIMESPPSRIRMHSGILSTRNGAALNFAMPPMTDSSDIDANDEDRRLLESFYGRIERSFPKNAASYLSSNHRITNMKIIAGTSGSRLPHVMGIGIRGGGNVIRNSTIIVENGNAALLLLGPNQLIEDNVIIFRGTPALKLSAAIRLQQADGSVIRGNDIIIEGPLFGQGAVPISLVNTRGIRVENNRIWGSKELFKAWDSSGSVTLDGNVFENAWSKPSVHGVPGVRRK